LALQTCRVEKRAGVYGLMSLAIAICRRMGCICHFGCAAPLSAVQGGSKNQPYAAGHPSAHQKAERCRRGCTQVHYSHTPDRFRQTVTQPPKSGAPAQRVIATCQGASTGVAPPQTGHTRRCETDRLANDLHVSHLACLRLVEWWTAAPCKNVGPCGAARG